MIRKVLLALLVVVSLCCVVACNSTPAGPSLSYINISSLPSKTQYAVGEKLDLTGLVVSAVYSDGSSSEVYSFTASPANGTVLNEIGRQPVTVSYSGKKASFSVNVVQNAVSSISIKNYPTKMNYIVGELLDTTGLVLYAYYTDGSIIEVSNGFTATPTRLASAGTQEITVGYQGKITTYSVTVSKIEVTDISIKTLPTKLTYTVGDAVDTTGLVLNVYYSDGTTKEVNSGFTYSPTTLTTAGEKAVTVEYETKKTTYSVTVKPKDEYVLLAGNSWWNDQPGESKLMKSEISRIEFVKTVDDIKAGKMVAGKSWAVDVNKTGCIKCYIYEESGQYVLYFVGSIIKGNKDSSYMFGGDWSKPKFSNVTSIKFGHFDTANVENMSNMFYECSKLSDVDLSGFDTSSVINMGYMFYNCGGLTTLDVTGFKTSKVKYFYYMFGNCYGLASLDVTGFDTSSATNMNGMFQSCSGLKSLDVTGFNTSNVTSFSYMFSGCNNLALLNVRYFDTSKAVYMNGMFNSCSNVKELNVSKFNTSNVVNMSSMFSWCGNLTSISVGNFDTSKVENMNSMFEGCYNLVTLDLRYFNTSNVTDMSYMFYRTKFETLDLSSFDIGKVTNFRYMFYYCRDLTKILINNKWSVYFEAGSEDMFYGCEKLVGGQGTVYDSEHTDGVYARADNPDIGKPGYLTIK